MIHDIPLIDQSPKYWGMLKSKIESHYETHDCKRISQGDILRDIKFVIIGDDESSVELTYQYIVVLSQDCDLEQGNSILSPELKCEGSCKLFNQFLHSVLFVPAFPSELLRSGEHIKSLYDIKADRIVGSLWGPIKINQSPRYHFLPADVEHQIPDLVMDFKAYYTLPFRYFLHKHKKHYLATVNELFREHLSQRFSNYLNRIGLPAISRPGN
ncbi:MAG: hypothetical protein WAU91_09360 [Desulfatitalea sp.]